MATFLPGYAFIIWGGATTDLATAPFKTALTGAYKVNTAKNAFISFRPTSQFNNLPEFETGGVYLLVVASTVTIADALLGPPASRLVATFPASTTTSVSMKILAGDEGTYALDPDNPTTGLTSISYTKGGNTLTLPVALALNDTLIATGTTAQGVEGSLTLIKQ